MNHLFPRSIRVLCLFLLLSLILQPYSSRICSKGCVKCLSTGECVICDILNNYARISGTCIQNILENCNLRSFNGECLVCEKQYFLDFGKCVSAGANVLENCEIYFTATSCQQCAEENYLKNGTCLKVGQVITDCIVYNSDATKCSLCKPGLILSLDLLQCEKISSEKPAPNCLSYSQIGCRECKNGFMVNLNKYLIDTGNLDSIKGKKNDNISITSNSVSYLTSNLENYLRTHFYSKKINDFDFCLSKTIDFCKEFYDFDKCKTCEDNYILTPEYDCLEYPYPRIQDCTEYLTKTVCKKCNNKFYLNTDSTSCIESIEIPNCSQYSYTTANTCIECTTKYFENNGSCQQRNFEIIEKCIKNWINLDGCETCDLGFTTNLNNQKCVPSIGNCLEFDRQADSVNCSVCLDGFFLELLTKCSKGVITGCLKYTNQSTCESCEAGYYLNGTSCDEHSLKNQVYNCLEFSSIYLNKCNQCDKTSVSYFNSGFCLPVDTIISGCKKYSNSLTCESCFEDSSYLSSNQCVVGSISSCLEYHESQNECLRCKIDFEKNESYISFPSIVNNKCYLGNPNIHHNCKELETSGEQEKCKVCETQHYPSAHVSNKLAFCVPRSFYRLYADANSLSAVVDYEKLVFCELWDYDLQRCRKCKIKKVISHTGKCMDSCATDERLETFKFNTSSPDEVHLDSYFQCTDSNENYGVGGFKNTYRKCYRVETNLRNNNELCMDCDSTSIGVIDFDSNIGKNGIFRYIPNSLIASYSLQSNITPLSGCVSRTTSISAATTTDITKVVTIDGTIEADLNNCRFVMKIGVDSFGCVACKFGFSGQVVQDKDKQGNFIKNCLTIEECERSTFYDGLGSLPNQSLSQTYYLLPVDFYASCHKCSNNKIPTISILKNQIASSISNSKGIAKFIYPFGFASATTSDIGTAQSATGTITSCQSNGMGKIGLSNCGMMQYFPDLAIVQFELLEGSINSEANPLCIACKPGYKPTMSVNAENAFAVTVCEVIENCNSSDSKTFNMCDLCTGQFSLKYDNAAPNKLTYGLVCVSSGQENCLVYDMNLTHCVKCTQGYFLNIDFICDSVDSYQCEQQGYYTKDSLHVATNYSLTGHGCNKCTGDLISMRFSNIFSTCVLSQSLKPGSNANSSFLITNCSFYGINEQNEIICALCNEISISSENMKLCFIIPNSLENCLLVSNTSQENNVKCSICQDYYYKDDFDYCNSGTIQNCIKYNSSTECSQCRTGYFRTQVKDGRIICMKPNAQPCSTYDESSALIGNLKCNLCQSNYFYTSAVLYGNFPLTDCLQIPAIDFCIEYQNVGGVLNSTLSCTKCEPNYFVLTALRCSQRIKQNIPNCLEMSITEDKCGNCSLGYFVNTSGDCELYPSGVINCIEYKDEKECIKCTTKYYLLNNECLRSSKLVKDCSFYNADGLCSECRAGFFLNNRECQLGDAIDCKTFKNKGECETCPDGYGLIPDNENLSCIEIKIDNCSVPDVNSQGPNFKCEQCDVGFYVNSNFTCTAVPSQIEYCGIYDTASTCQLCFNNYVLVSNKKKCVLSTTIENFIDKNCLNSFISPEPICNLCNIGYYFAVPTDKLLIDAASTDVSSKENSARLLASEGRAFYEKVGLLQDELDSQMSNQCVACPNNEDGNCALCYPKNPEFCLLCNTMYTHNSDGTCELTDPLPPPEDTSGVSVFRAFKIVALMFLVQSSLSLLE